MLRSRLIRNLLVYIERNLSRARVRNGIGEPADKILRTSNADPAVPIGEL
ncbi:MAG TPA: hypothetical protein VFL57_01585 [Bryobacteraceae bacterium]|nr:hypothetical protein [Bryobacteraceae bacterium]